MEISEVTLFGCAEHPDKRMDAEFHRKLDPESPRHEWVAIGDILTMSQYGASIEMNEDGNGISIYRMNEMHHMLCDSSISKYAELPASEIEKLSLASRDVLFNRTNSQEFVGRTGLYLPFTDETRIFASYLVRFRTDEKQILPEFLVAFLNTPRGIAEIKRRARMSINQSNVNPEEVKAVRIPKLALPFQRRIQNLFALAHDRLKQSEQDQREAGEHYLTALQLDTWQPPTALSYEKPASAAFTSGRLDAEFFHPRIDELFSLLGDRRHAIDSVARLRKERFVATQQQFNYLEIGAVSTDGVVSDSIIDGQDAPSRATWRVHHGDIITSTVRPIRGLTAMVEPNQENAVASSGFAVLEPTGVSPELLLCYLKLPQICELMDLHTSASMYPAISVPDILNLPFQHPGARAEKEIVNLVREAREKRQQSKTLLERAKRAVEIAIEQDEETAFAYLDGKHYVAEEILPKLFGLAGHYVDLETIESTIEAEGIHYESATVKRYLMQWQKEGRIHDAGRGWYSDLLHPFAHDSGIDIVNRVLKTMESDFPLLDQTIWSTRELTPYFHHLPSRHATFLMVDRDALDPVGDALTEAGFRVANHPLGDIAKKFSLAAKDTIILRPRLATDHTETRSPIEHTLVDLYHEIDKLQLFDGQEYRRLARNLTSSCRINVAAMSRYAKRRKIDAEALLGIIL